MSMQDEGFADPEMVEADREDRFWRDMMDADPEVEGDLAFLGGAALTPENDPTHPSGGVRSRPFPTAEETRRYIAAELDEPYVEPDPLDRHRVPKGVSNFRYIGQVRFQIPPESPPGDGGYIGQMQQAIDNLKAKMSARVAHRVPSGEAGGGQ